MTLTDDQVLVIYILIAYTCISFLWLLWREAKLTNDDEGYWYDWVLCIPVLLLAGLIGIFQVIFTDRK